MAISATAFRQDAFRLLDQVAQTGKPLEITLKGRRLRIVSADDQQDWLSRLVPHEAIVGDAEELAGLDMSDTWEGHDQL